MRNIIIQNAQYFSMYDQINNYPYNYTNNMYNFTMKRIINK